MALIKPKMRKAIFKEVKHQLIKHGSEIAVGLIMGLITNYFADALGKSGKSKKKKHK